MEPKKPVLKAEKITKRFSGVVALNKVDFNLLPGEIHGIMGENGAGKSTLIKCLTGVHTSYEGNIFYDSKKIQFKSPLDATKTGISTVYQEINLVPTLTIAENIFAGRQPYKNGRLDWKYMKERSAEILKLLDVNIDVSDILSQHSTAIQQMVAIARALDISAKVLILDEPTSSLDEEESEKLFSVMKKLKSEGMGIIFISHFLDQVISLCDRLTVLRNGELIGEYITSEISKHELIVKMLGRELANFTNTSKAVDIRKNNEVFYKIRGMEKKQKVNKFDLDIRKGEVLGLAGLLGSGRTEMAKLLFGIDKPAAGEVHIRGTKNLISSPQKAIKQSFGYCPEDRKTEGLILDLTVRENIILALQVKNGIFKYIPVKKQREIANKFSEYLKIKTPSIEENVSRLSGGNQQKVILARWLAANPEFLILDEPTRGIDVGAKMEIQKLIIKFKEEGMSILFISSEIEEVIRCSDRVAIMRERTKTGELSGKDVTGEKIMHALAHGLSR